MSVSRHAIAAAKPGEPAPIQRTLTRLIHFHEVDLMGVMWFGHYARLIDEACAHLHHHCGFTYDDFRREGIMAPVKRFEVDYVLPLVLGEQVRISASLLWSEAMRMDTAIAIYKQDDRLAATAHVTQLFVDAATFQPFMTEVPFVRRQRDRWKNGEFA